MSDTDVTAVTVNFKTPDLLCDCLTSFHQHYPDVPHIVVDNGGCPASLEALADLSPRLVISNSRNVGHGPALNEALALVGTPYAFTLDSDTRTERGGFLEKMLARFQADPRLFALGWLRWVNPAGVAFPNQEQREGLAYVHPFACLLDVNKFQGLHPFADCGAPAIHLMRDALAHGYVVEDFPVADYLWHKQAGTRGMFGGRWKAGTGEKPSEWNRFGI